MRTEGKPTFLRWLLAHPDYLVAEPMRSPERVFNNAEGSIDFYAAADRPQVPLVSSLAWPSTTAAVGVAVVAGATVWPDRRRLDRGQRAVAVVAGTLLVSAPVIWYSGGMETARHLVPAALLLRLGALLAASVAVARWPRSAGS